MSSTSPKQVRWAWLAFAWLAPVVILGVKYMTLPYRELENSGIVFGPGLVVIAAIAMLVCTFGGVKVLPTAAATTLGLVTLVMLRVVVDGVADPTSHNLWPFEVGIAVVFGGAAALGGAILGSLARRALLSGAVRRARR